MGQPRGRAHLWHRHDGAGLHRALPATADLPARRNGGRGRRTVATGGEIRSQFLRGVVSSRPTMACFIANADYEENNSNPIQST